MVDSAWKHEKAIFVVQVEYLIFYFLQVVMVQWITPLTLNQEVPGSHPLPAAVVPLGKHVIITA